MNGMRSARRLFFLLPGKLDTLTGGTIYDKQIVAGLRAIGWQVDVLSLRMSFPWPDAQALDEAASLASQLPDGAWVIADGLAFGAMPAVAQQHARRLRWLALVHHPLALETGLGAKQRQQLYTSERQALSAAHAVVVTSATTARALADYGVAATRIHVVEPGTARAPLAVGTAGTTADEALSLLCVATITARKGHRLLIEALAGLQDRRWMLHCVGSVARDAETSATLRDAIAHHGLAHRVLLHGELAADALEAAYSRADVFVLPSLYEGYGMALAEAIAHGLPIVSTSAGAIPDTVPAAAGVLVPPGDAVALRSALARMFDEPVWRAMLAGGARAARLRLTGWPEAVDRFAAVLARIEQQTAGREATGSSP